MAEKRMFAKSIVLSDAFLDMPMSARCLYFTLSMFADDDGFVGSPKGIMRQCGASEDDLRVLLSKRYVLAFESGVIVIKHWRINNFLRKDRHIETTYQEELKTLTVDDKGAYKELGQPMVNQWSTQNSIDKNSIDKNEGIYMNNIGDDENAEVQPIPELTDEQIKEIISLWNRNTCVVPLQWITPLTKRYDMTKLCIRYGYELFCEVIKSIDGQALFQKWKERNRLLCYDDFTDPEFFQKIAEGNYKNRFKDTEKPSGNKFNKFEQRQYDFDALEEKLFGGG